MLLELPAAAQNPLANEPITPLPSLKSLNLDERKIQLGEKLFFDTRLSKDNTVACVSCHAIDKDGADGRRTSVGIRLQEGPINAPTVFNSGFNFRQFWDGRAASLESQIDGVVHNPKEFDSSWPEILLKFIPRFGSDSPLVAEFRAVYSDGMNERNAKDAIATYERSLITPSRFDRYLLGDGSAISADEKNGYQLFKQYGCVACHQGVNVGGNMFQKFGVFNQYFERRGNINTADFGRFNVTKRETDRFVFKVPSLRNVALTAPYFHDGSAKTLNEAVDVMFLNQIGRPAPEEDKRLIVLFLRSLTGSRFEGAK